MKRTLLEIWFLLHCWRGKDDKKKDHFWILTCNLSWTSIFLFNFYPSLWYHKREIQKQQDKRESRSRLSLRLHSFNSTLFCIGTKQTRNRSQGSELLGGCISLTQEVCDFFFFLGDFSFIPRPKDRAWLQEWTHWSIFSYPNRKWN